MRKLRKNVSKAIAFVLTASTLMSTSVIGQLNDVQAAEKTYNMLEGMTAKVLPKYTQKKGTTYVYESSNTSIAKVDAETGIVTGVKSGSCTIKVTRTQDNKKATATYKINVATLQIKDGDSSLAVGETSTFKTNVKNVSVTWKSTDENIVKVDSEGKITAVGTGNATVVALYQNALAVKKITVYATNSESFRFTQTPSVVALGSSVSFNTTKETATYSSSNTNVIKINSNGVATAVGVGKATIYASHSGKTISTNVTVYSSTNDVAINGNETVLTVGTQKIFTTSLQNAKWYSSNPNVLSINEATGLVTAKSTGTVVIYAVSGNQTSAITLTVVDDQNGSLQFVEISNSYKLGTYNFVRANKSGVTWFSSNPEVATIDSNSGLLFAKSLGTTKIYGVLNGKIITRDIVVDTTGSSSNINITASKTTLVEGETVVFTTNKEVNWLSSNTSVVTVNPKTGIVTAVKEGTAFIYAVSTTGEVAYVPVNVLRASYTTAQQEAINDANLKIQALLENLNVTFSNTIQVKTYLQRCNEALENCYKLNINKAAISKYDVYFNVLQKYLAIETVNHTEGGTALATQKQSDLAQIEAAINTWLNYSTSEEKIQKVSTVDTLIEKAKSAYFINYDEINKISDYNAGRKAVGLGELK